MRRTEERRDELVEARQLRLRRFLADLALAAAECQQPSEPRALGGAARTLPGLLRGTDERSEEMSLGVHVVSGSRLWL